jgi:hypothetical protein
MTSRKRLVRPPAAAAGWTRSPGGRLVLLAFAASRVFLLFFHGHVATDLKIYRSWLLEAASGRVPYLDFPIEYPPLAWWWMHLPGVLDKAGYYFRFRLLMGAFDLAAFALLLWIVARLRPSALSAVGGLYIASSVVLEYLLFDRLDIGVLFFTVAGLAAWLRAEESPRPEAWRTLAYIAIALGASYKLFPGFVLPVFVIADLRTGARWRAVGARLALAGGAALAPVAAAWLHGGRGVLDFLAYHGTRGVEIESTWASLMWLAGLPGDPVAAVVRYGCWEIVGPFEAVARAVSAVAAVLFVAGGLLWAAALRQRLDARRACLQAALLLGGFVIVAKVFSPQYLLWSTPLLALVAAEVLDTRRAGAVFVGLSVAVAVLTTVFFPFGRSRVETDFDWMMLVLLARNAISVGVVVWLARRLAARDRATAAANG